MRLVVSVLFIMAVVGAGLSNSAVAKPAPAKPAAKVVEQRLGKLTEDIYMFKVSPDGKRMAHAAKKGKKWFLVVDGRDGTKYDGLVPVSQIFSPDGKCVAYIAMTGKKQFVVVDGREGSGYDMVVTNTLIFTPAGVATYLAVRDGVLFRVTSAHKP